jgi:hypothetical protein
MEKVNEQTKETELRSGEITPNQNTTKSSITKKPSLIDFILTTV